MSVVLALISCTAFASSPQATAQDSAVHDVSVPGVSETITIRVPVALRLASGQTGSRNREALIDAYTNNPLGKGIASEIFCSDWTAPGSPPLLVVGTLPLFLKLQGRIDRQYWTGSKKELDKQARLLAITITQQMVTYGLPNHRTAIDRMISSGTEDEVTIVGFTPTSRTSGDPALLLVRKLVYVRKSVVLFELAVAAEKPDAIGDLERMSALTKVIEGGKDSTLTDSVNTPSSEAVQPDQPGSLRVSTKRTGESFWTALWKSFGNQFLLVLGAVTLIGIAKLVWSRIQGTRGGPPDDKQGDRGTGAP